MVLTIDADTIAHKLLDENSATVAQLFGEQYVQDGHVQRKSWVRLSLPMKKINSNLKPLSIPYQRSNRERSTNL